MSDVKAFEYLTSQTFRDKHFCITEGYVVNLI